MAHPGGRPTKYDPSFPSKVDEYLETTGKNQMHLPKIQSLALYLGVNEDTLVEWGKKYPEFSASLRRLMERQAEQLIDDGIYGGKEVNATIVKLLLMNNHGMREKSDSDITTQGDKITQVVIVEDKPTESE